MLALVAMGCVEPDLTGSWIGVMRDDATGEELDLEWELTPRDRRADGTLTYEVSGGIPIWRGRRSRATGCASTPGGSRHNAARAVGSRSAWTTRAAVVTCDVDGREVTVDMGRAELRGVDVPFVVGADALAAVLVSVGNLHCVVFVDRCPAGRLLLEMPGGTLEVTVGDALALRLRGPVEPVGVFLPVTA